MSMSKNYFNNFKIDIREENFDIDLETKSLIDNKFTVGAVVTFLGLVRDLSENVDLKFMEIEHYPEMTLKVLRKICNDTAVRWDLRGLSLIHRVGKLYPGENIVLLVIAAAHRTEAYKASEFLMDFLKSRAPFWKKETTSNGATWVEENEWDKQKLLQWE